MKAETKTSTTLTIESMLELQVLNEALDMYTDSFEDVLADPRTDQDVKKFNVAQDMYLTLPDHEGLEDE